jgi:Ca-activated chloride channel homolog
MDGSLSVLFEFLVPPLPPDTKKIVLATGQISLDVPSLATPTSITRLGLFRNVLAQPNPEPPPTGMLNALSRLTLYRIQERASNDISNGNFEGATKHLNNLATNLFAQGETELARSVLREAENLRHGIGMSEEAKKHIKYGTRALLLPASADAFTPFEDFVEGQL